MIRSHIMTSVRSRIYSHNNYFSIVNVLHNSTRIFLVLLREDNTLNHVGS